MAEEVLFNDGGAPARILPFTAAEDITAGAAIEIDTAGKAKLADTDGVPVAGFALVDAASGAKCNVISGSGLVLNAFVDGGTVDVAVGDFLEVGENGTLIKQATPADTTVVAVALEANTAAASATALFKVLVL